MKNRGKHIETILVLVTALVVLFLIFELKGFLLAGLGLSVVGLAIPILAKWIHEGWMGFAKVLGFINSHILLSLIFFLILTPLALARKLFTKKDPLQLKKQDEGSYFVVREHEFTAEDLEHPW
ncbi:MAG: SxtJ family membrane protein [Bacteroidota bacterium]